jgi:hypothetical protein
VRPRNPTDCDPKPDHPTNRDLSTKAKRSSEPRGFAHRGFTIAVIGDCQGLRPGLTIAFGVACRGRAEAERRVDRLHGADSR